MWKKTLKTIETQKSYHKGFLKREEQLNKEYQANILLYNDIRSQRNKYLRLVDVINFSTILQFEDTILLKPYLLISLKLPNEIIPLRSRKATLS